MKPARSSLLVVAAVSGMALAVPARTLAELVHEPELIRPPRLPSAVAGLFLLRGRVVPVLRPEVLLHLPPPPPGPFRVLLVFHGTATAGQWALLVERAVGVVEAPNDRLRPVPAGHSLGDSVVALFVGPDGRPDEAVPVVAPERLLLRHEEAAVAELARMAEQRWEEFAVGHP